MSFNSWPNPFKAKAAVPEVAVAPSKEASQTAREACVAQLRTELGTLKQTYGADRVEAAMSFLIDPPEEMSFGLRNLPPESDELMKALEQAEKQFGHETALAALKQVGTEEGLI